LDNRFCPVVVANPPSLSKPDLLIYLPQASILL
jgi:hypothetical protein